MLTSKLTEFEKNALRLFFDLYPHWKRMMNRQIRQSNLQRICNSSNYSVYFINNKKDEQKKLNLKMPVEVILGRVELPKNDLIRDINGCNTISPCILSVLDNNAVGVRVYFDDEYLSELEVYSLSGKKLEEDLPKNSPRIYIVYDNEDSN